MPRKTISFELDFMTKDILPRFTVKQFDDVSLNITPLMNNVPYTTTNMTCVIYIGCDNDLFQQNTDIVVSSNSINIKLNKAMLQNYGRAYAELELKDSNGTVTSSTFLFNIEKKIGEGATIPGSIEGFVAKYERLIAEFKSQVNTTINNCNTNVDNKLNTVDSLINVKISDFEKRFNRLISSQQQDAEVVDARDGETSLKARLDRDIEKAKQVYINVEGSNISTDSSSGYLKDVEILGNTIQDENNLADIRSVGDKVEGQELYKIPVLSCGKNINSSLIKRGNINANTGIEESGAKTMLCTENFIHAKSETAYVISSNISIGSVLLMCYNENKEYLGYCIASNGYFETKIGTKYVKFRFAKSLDAEFTDLEVSSIKVQLEEGTVATPYEPYQEDKLTILSPVQLEKVGDVRDRIICKDGAWGVEKNVNTVVLDESMAYSDVSDSFPSDNSCMFAFATSDIVLDTIILCDKFPNVNISNENNRNIEGIFTSVYSDSYAFYFRIFNDKLPTQNIPGLRQWLSKNNITIKYKTSQPQFIPLPHDQQVKLRTFANKTNISFLTEIEGTIKAQVPKSLGATVNTHTEQISNLNKELDRVKKLEESTVSTVTTESDFTTVEATSNGYFEDVKLEGKTLVNLFRFKEFRVLNGVNLYAYSKDNGNDNITSNKTFTFRNNTNKRIILDIQENGAWKRSVILDANKQSIVTTTITEYITAIYGQNSQGWDVNSDAHKQELKNSCILLEGDHTQNPPSYFEGLKSVGQDVDEVTVESVKGDGNLVNIYEGFYTNPSVPVFTNGESLSYIATGSYHHFKFKRVNFIEGEKYTVVLKGNNCRLLYNNGNLSSTGIVNNEIKYKTFIAQKNSYCEGLENSDLGACEVRIDGVWIYKGEYDERKHISHISNKKRLLYYNEETQTWEKPILREWDSIEKHADGKYYYHQRSGEVVFNASESNWSVRSVEDTEKTSFGKALYGSKPCENHLIATVICDKFTVNSTTKVYECLVDGVAINKNSWIYFSLNSELANNSSTFNQWLQANNVTVVYQLAEEKVYECTNIDLITYANETNYIVESGVLSPKTTLKVHSNISNVVSLLQKKVSLLESDITSYMITQNRLMLASRYNADTVSFKVDVATLRNSFEYDNDLYELILNNILVGKDNYDREYIENLIIFYWMDFVISDEMYFTLFEIIEGQHDPKVIEDEEAPL
ncbi:hypothetical protein [Romboutsia ilealis]|uniref:hypothetical protein n=1 Tax=Romboutsia ilealis TaxID=1115758 RepID=UPI0023F03FEB|nr:hypothetical protein [Romboutsia ilealis]